MLNVFTKLKKKQHEIMLKTFSLSLIIWKTAIETCPGNERGPWEWTWGSWRAEQFPHLRNYTLTPDEETLLDESVSRQCWMTLFLLTRSFYII